MACRPSSRVHLIVHTRLNANEARSAGLSVRRSLTRGPPAACSGRRHIAPRSSSAARLGTLWLTTTSSSSAAAITAWSTPPISPGRGGRCWWSSGATCSAARPSPKKYIPGFKYSVCSYVVSLLRPEIIRELDLPRHGLEILPLDGTFTPMPDGDYLWRVNDHAKTRREIARHSKVDAEAYDEYGKAMVEMGRFVKPILNMTPPDPTSLEPRGLKDLLFLGRRFQALSDQDKYNQVQLMTMSAVDFLDQWFETDVLKATMSASGIIGTFLGVRSPGTAYVLLHHYMGEIDGAFRSWGLSRGGTGAISERDRRCGARSRRRDPHRDLGLEILVKEGAAAGVVLENGDYFTANVVSSSLDPHQTFLEDGRSRAPAGRVRRRRPALQVPGIVGEGQPGARRAARFHRPARARRAPARRGLDLAEHRVHGARLRRGEVRTLLAPSLHRHRHPEPDRPVGRAAGQARDVLLRAVRALPPEGRAPGTTIAKPSATPSSTRSRSTRRT